MADADQLARRMTELVTTLARRGMVLASGVALVTLVVGALTYLTGLAGLEGSARSAWTVVGLIMLAIAVGAPLVARWRLSRVSKDAAALIGEIGTLIRRDAAAERVVIDTVTIEEASVGGTRVPVIIDTRQVGRLRQVTLTANDLRSLPAALRAVTTFPALLGIALLLVLVFGVLGFVFLIAWTL